MKPDKITLVGKVSDSGSPLISNQLEMLEFFKKWNGQPFIMEAVVYPEEKGSELMIAYYFKKVVTDFQQIFKETDGERLSLAETDERLRKLSPSMIEEIPKEESGGFDLARVLSAYEVSSSRLREHIDFARYLAATEYNFNIKEPKK